MALLPGFSCAACGRPRALWDDPGGFPREGLDYCCDGCAEGLGCDCSPAAAPPPFGRPGSAGLGSSPA